MNPLAYLLPAVNAALTATPLLWAGATVPAEQYLSEYPRGPYVLIEQPTDTDAGGAKACAHYTCTVLLNVVTQFSKGQVTAAPAEAIVSQINARLRRQRLSLGSGWDCQPGELVLTSQLVEDSGQQVLVRRLLRYRWEVYYSGPVDTLALPTATIAIPSAQVSVPIALGRVLSLTQAAGVSLYDATKPDTGQSLYGISLTSSAGQSVVQVQTASGVINIPGWGLVSGALYFAGPNGTMLRTDAGMYFSQILGRALGPDSFLYQPEDIVVLVNP